MLLLLLASSITAFVSPAAGGSGIPEVKAYLNGVDAPNIFSLRTLAVKVRSYPPASSPSLSLPARGPLTAASCAPELYCLLIEDIINSFNCKMVLPPFQIIVHLTFLTLSLNIRLIQKFMQNITFFCCELLYQYKIFKNDLSLVMFA